MGFYTNYDPECLRAYADAAAENFDWMVNVLGGDPELLYPTKTADWPTPFHYDEHDSHWGIDRKGYVMVWDEFPEFEGHEHSIVLSFSGTEFDSSYYNQLRQNIDEREGENLTVWLGCPGVDLILDENKAVIGCYVEKDGERIAIKAKGGVCLCVGGYESNRTMIANYCQLPYLYPRAAALNTGDGVVMGLKAGADLWHMSNISGLGFGYHAEGKVGASTLASGVASIKVGPAGGRFMNEDAKSRHGRVSFGGAWNMTPMAMPAYLITDSTQIGTPLVAGGGRFMNEDAKSRHGRVSFGGAWNMTPMAMPAYLITDSTQIGTPLVAGFSEGNADEIASGIILQGDTVDALSEAIRAQGKAPNFNANGELEATLTAYNADVEAGVTDDFGRTPTVALNTPPYYALELCPTCLNTQGGPRHNGLAQVASGIILQGDTVDALSEAIRAQGKAPNFNANGELEATLTAYNADVEAGVTDDFGRTPTVALNTPPYYALELCPTCLNTQGGPRHNGLAQVLNTEAMPIEGLFSGGELGSIFPDMYNGGGNLGETMVFGRIAGRNAAHRAQGTFEGATEPARYEQQDLDDADAQAKADQTAADAAYVIAGRNAAHRAQGTFEGATEPARYEQQDLDDADAQAKADQTAADAAYVGADLADGTYEGTGKGYSSDIVLEVTIADGKIADVQVVSSAETATLGEVALPEYAAAIVETQDPTQIDVAAGASNTLRGFVDAINDALSQAAQ